MKFIMNVGPFQRRPGLWRDLLPFPSTSPTVCRHRRVVVDRHTGTKMESVARVVRDKIEKEREREREREREQRENVENVGEARH